VTFLLSVMSWHLIELPLAAYFRARAWRRNNGKEMSP
jgi:peptidoglycan/LPS O-acetylase OafA/YrhL